MNTGFFELGCAESHGNIEEKVNNSCQDSRASVWSQASLVAEYCSPAAHSSPVLSIPLCNNRSYASAMTRLAGRYGRQALQMLDMALPVVSTSELARGTRQSRASAARSDESAGTCCRALEIHEAICCTLEKSSSPERETTSSSVTKDRITLAERMAAYTMSRKVSFPGSEIETNRTYISVARLHGQQILAQEATNQDPERHHGRIQRDHGQVDVVLAQSTVRRQQGFLPYVERPCWLGGDELEAFRASNDRQKERSEGVERGRKSESCQSLVWVGRFRADEMRR